MLNQEDCSVNTTNYNVDKNEEIMVPYCRVLLIAWDKDVGMRLKDLRNAKGLSQPKLARLTNGMVSKETVVSLELGRVDAVSREKLDALLETLGCDVRSLFPTVTVKNF